jgi:hypothetical protein
MGIRVTFTKEDLRRYAQKQAGKFVKGTLAAYRAACIDMVKRAKSTNTYIDRTGNLRSSIGYVLCINGVEVDSSFKGVGEEGVRKGYELATRIAGNAGSNGIVAVVVAGMDYALYVEAKGYDVLTGSTRQFAGDLRKYFDDVNSQFGTQF